MRVKTFDKRFYPLIPVIWLLLLQVFIRTHHLDVQNPYIDEGFHIRRAGFVWDFEFHPARVSHGKLLVYFWLGLFETDRLHVLVPSRMAIALISLITGAALYAIGKKLHSHTAGLLALFLYIFCPIALFYERMAMADPLASTLATLVVWRSLIFVKKPTLMQGAVIGLLIGLAAMAKLTMGLTPVIPVLTAVIFYQWKPQHLIAQFREWLNIYFSPLLAAAFAVVLVWLPILIPAAVARNTDEPFKLINAYNVRSNAESDEDKYTPLEYIEEVRVEMDDFFTENLLIFMGMIFLVAILIQPQALRKYLYIFIWFGVIVLPSLVGARLATSRYFMPMSAPLMFALAFVIVSLWKNSAEQLRIWSGMRKLTALTALCAAVFWLATHAIPFAQTDLTNPDKIDFEETNYTEYQSGFLIANDAERKAAAVINEMQPKYLIANWNLCHYLYFYTDKEVPCLGLDTVRQDLRDFVDVLPENESGYLILSGYQPFFQRMEGIGSEEIIRVKQERIRTASWDVQIWRLWKTN